LLEQNLEEEKAADQKLNELAEGGINQGAAESSQGGDEAEDEEDESEPARPSARRARGNGASRGNGSARRMKR